MADQSILISTVLPASLMPLFYGQLTSELGNFEHWPFSTVWENSSGYFEQWELLIRDCCMHNISLHSQTDRCTFSMTGMELSHGRAWAGDWLRAEFPKLAKDLSIFIKDQSICADRQMSIQNGLEPFHAFGQLANVWHFNVGGWWAPIKDKFSWGVAQCTCLNLWT